jgi:hypothetical protein
VLLLHAPAGKPARHGSCMLQLQLQLAIKQHQRAAAHAAVES